MTLRDGLLWLMGPGAGVLAWWLLRRLEGSVSMAIWWLRGWFVGLGAEDRRLVAFALAAVLAWAGYGLTLVMLYGEPPATWRAWVEELFGIAFAAITTSQVLHGAVELRARDRAEGR